MGDIIFTFNILTVLFAMISIIGWSIPLLYVGEDDAIKTAGKRFMAWVVILLLLNLLEMANIADHWFKLMILTIFFAVETYLVISDYTYTRCFLHYKYLCSSHKAMPGSFLGKETNLLAKELGENIDQAVWKYMERHRCKIGPLRHEKVIVYYIDRKQGEEYSSIYDIPITEPEAIEKIEFLITGKKGQQVIATCFYPYDEAHRHIEVQAN